MGEVLIPVPAEHVDQFRQYLFQRILVNNLTTGDIEALAGVRDRLTGRAGAVFAVLSRTSAVGRFTSCEGVAEAVDATVPEVLEHVVEINAAMVSRKLPACLVTEARSTTTATGDEAVETVIYMLPHLARRLELVATPGQIEHDDPASP